MPLTRIAAPAHLPRSKLQALANAAQQGLITACKVPADDLFQLITRFEAQDIILDPHYGGVTRSRDACIVEVTFLSGRTDEQKRELYRHIAQAAVEAGFRSDDIMIALTENSRIDWSLGHGEAFADRAH